MSFGDNTNNNINRFLSDKVQITLSNFPGYNQSDLPAIELFVKSCTFPDTNINFFTSTYLDYTIRQPEAPKKNNNFSMIQLDFKLCEDLKNYLMFFNWIRSMKYALSEPLGDNTTILRKYFINSINIQFLDLKKRPTTNIQFTNCFIQSLSSLPLIFGTADEIIFTTNLSYEEMNINPQTQQTGGLTC